MKIFEIVRQKILKTSLQVSIIILCSSCVKNYLLQRGIEQALTINNKYVTTACNNSANINISVEFCDEAYLIDTKSKDRMHAEHPSATKSNKVIFIHFTIENFKKEYNTSYASKLVTHNLYIIDEAKPSYPIVKVINIDKDNKEIVWMNPTEISANYASRTSGTIRTSISWNAQLDYELEALGEKKYKFYLKTTYPSYTETSQNPPRCYTLPFCNGSDDYSIVTEIYSQYINLKNYQRGYDGQDKREKIMNLYMFGNTSECDMTNYKWVSTTRVNSFAETFSMVWAGEGYSDIHVLPNFMPSNSSYVNSDKPINNTIPEFLVSKDGYMVLTPEDFSNSTVRDKISAQDKVKSAITLWKYRFFDFLTWKHKNANSSYNGLSPFDMYPSDCKLNIGALITVKGFKIYDGNKYTANPTLKSTQLIFDNSKNDSIDIGQINKEFNWFGVTLLDACSDYLGISIIFRNTHLRYPTIISDGFCISTAMHELAHLWNINGTTDRTLASDEDKHHAYVKGFDSDYCLMRISPSIGSDYLNFYSKQVESMKFSDGVEQRITNTMIYKK